MCENAKLFLILIKYDHIETIFLPYKVNKINKNDLIVFGFIKRHFTKTSYLYKIHIPLGHKKIPKHIWKMDLNDRYGAQESLSKRFLSLDFI